MADATIDRDLAAVRAGVSDAEIEATAARAVLRRKQLVVALRIGLLALLLGGWELSAQLGWIDPFFFAMPTTILGRLVEWATEGTSEGPLWYHLFVTMEEALIGFVTGSAAGIVVGVALGRSRLASDVFSIYIKVINAIPRVVLAPIFIMVFGLGLGSKVALAFVMVFFVVFHNAFQGVREADRAMIANARILGASSWQLTRSVIVPSAMSWIFASLHVSFGFAIIGAIVGEFVGARYGIGLLINVAKGSFDAAGMYAAIVLVMVVALAAEYLMTFVENRLAKWRPQALIETQ
jgi:NitT/TauT family transport system permease protein